MNSLKVFFNNQDDKNKCYYGDLLTDPRNVNEYTVYIDVLEPCCLRTQKMDYKQQYIKSVSMDQIIFVGTLAGFEESKPEYFLNID
jgi:hypothetical protein